MLHIFNSFVRERVFYHLNERFASSRTRDMKRENTSSIPCDVGGSVGGLL